MFNNTSQNNNISQNIRINAVTGAILKNHPKSWFERFHLRSERANELFQEGGHKYYGDKRWKKNPNPEKDITVLQMVICGDMEVMAELIYTQDYETSKKGSNV